MKTNTPANTPSSDKEKVLYRIDWDIIGVVKSRPNRFLALVDLEEKGTFLKDEKVHVHDPGRLKELIYPGNRVLVRRTANPNRKTAWDLIAAEFEGEWILINSAFHRKISEAILSDAEISPFGAATKIKAEVSFGHSRMDFVISRRSKKDTVIEVKGCTLAVDGRALFPDAPTERGARHVRTLMELKSEGMDAAIMILVLRPEALCFAPFTERDPKFSEAFYEAMDGGVEVHPVLLEYKDSEVRFLKHIGVCER